MNIRLNCHATGSCPVPEICQQSRWSFSRIEFGGGRGPSERGLVFVVVGHKVADLADQRFDAGEAAPPDRPLRDQDKPALHLMEPGDVGGFR